MISKKTVLVLGAGASKPYGYPLQNEFKKEILGKLQDKNMRSTLTEVHGFSEFVIDNFFSSFNLSGSKYIEEFLTERKEFLEIGKLVITDVIKEHENLEALFKEESWYVYLFNIMKDSFEDFGKNKLSIITFNFDVSIEAFFFNALKNSYNKSEQEIYKQLEKIPILHMYGRIGNIPTEGIIREIPYGKNTLCRPSVEETRGINILSEKDIIFDAVVKRAHSTLKEAEVIIFLGFGYDDVNMRRLNIVGLEEKKIIGSTFGIMSGEIKSIIKKSNNKVSLGKTKLVQALDVKDFLKESGALLL
ncbi:MAG: hypothetical protein V4664_03410 [Patescibacteria group bacterium]